MVNRPQWLILLLLLQLSLRGSSGRVCKAKQKKLLTNEGAGRTASLHQRLMLIITVVSVTLRLQQVTGQLTIRILFVFCSIVNIAIVVDRYRTAPLMIGQTRTEQHSTSSKLMRQRHNSINGHHLIDLRPTSHLIHSLTYLSSQVYRPAADVVTALLWQ